IGEDLSLVPAGQHVELELRDPGIPCGRSVDAQAGAAAVDLRDPCVHEFDESVIESCGTRGLPRCRGRLGYGFIVLRVDLVDEGATRVAHRPAHAWLFTMSMSAPV